MARALVDARRGALGARTDALERGALVDVAVLHVQVITAKAIVVLGVCDGGTQDLRDVVGSRTLGELQDLESLVNGLVADEVHDGASLARGNAHVACDGPDLVGIGVSHSSLPPS